MPLRRNPAGRPALSAARAAAIAIAAPLLVAQVASGAPSATTVFSYVGLNVWTGSSQSFVVPADVHRLAITARGGDGAGDTYPLTDPRKYGGHGAVVTTTEPVPVTPGATLTVYVAGRGEPGRGNNVAGKGGWGFGSGGQGGSGYAGGGGGGGTAVVSDLDGLLVVAGGGGGSGSAAGSEGGEAAAGGLAAGGDGGAAGAGSGGADGVGGAAGGPLGVGANATAGANFSLGAGADGGIGAKRSSGSRSIPFGGGGGGGYGGGGGGGGTGPSDYGAGGGAGGSFSVVDATFAASTLPWNPGDLRTGSSGEVTITTLPPPEVATLGASDITYDSALVIAEVNANGLDMTAVGVNYGTDAVLVGAGGGAPAALSPAAASGTSAVTMSAVLSGLEPETTYYFRAAGSSQGGEATGAVRSFTTTARPVAAPTAESQPVSATEPAPVPVSLVPVSPFRVPGIRTRSFVRRGWVLTSGLMPPGATSMVQVATRMPTSSSVRTRAHGATPPRRTTTVRHRCTVARRPGSSARVYRCGIRLGTGTWRVLTQARAGSRVVGQRPVVMRVVAPVRARVTG